MSFAQITAKTSKFIADNSPTILTVIGVAGTATTAVLTGKASFQASKLIQKYPNVLPDDAEKNREKTTFEKVRLVWTLYIPPVTTGALTIAAIIAANRVGLRRAATMAALYAGSEKKLAEYKDKVVEKFGAGKEQKVRDEIAQDHVTARPSSEMVILGSGQVMCYDMYSSRYFMSDMETIKQGMNNVNYRALNYGHATLTDLYDQLGIGRTKFSDDIGWKNDQLLEITFSTVMSDDQKPCIAIDYYTEPVRDFEHAH